LSNIQKFQYIVNGLREDLTFFENLYLNLDMALTMNPQVTSAFSYTRERSQTEVREWILDIFLDKIYDVDTKTQKFLRDVSLKEAIDTRLSTLEIEKPIREIVQSNKGLVHDKTYLHLESLKKAIRSYRDAFDITMNYVRKHMYKTEWKSMEKICIEDYIFQTQRRRYVTAREELDKARQAVRDGQWEEVLNHLRPAIDLALKEKFGFNYIHMKPFLDYSREHNELNLPSIDLIYFMFDEGSGRLHQGKINTPLECKSALEFVARFIDELDLITVSKEEIEEFKRKCNSVR